MGNRVQQKCWKCKKAVGGCSWSDRGVPVKNWRAEKTVIKENEGNLDSYLILECPEFVKDEPREQAREDAFLNMVELAKEVIGQV